MEDDLKWRMTFDGSQYLMDDEIRQKRPSIEDVLILCSVIPLRGYLFCRNNFIGTLKLGFGKILRTFSSPNQQLFVLVLKVEY